LYRAELVDRGIDFEMDLAADVPETALDAHQIQRVLLNLWRNAVDAMEGAAHAVAKALRITTARDGDAVRITVGDTGTGMPADVASRIFTPFFTTKRNGSGLGLAVVKKVIDDHQGRIDVDTVPGGGTTFIVTLPLER
ncbi:MAG: sensor histidine kinase, partial [Gemmatimonadales bacterium]